MKHRLLAAFIAALTLTAFGTVLAPPADAAPVYTTSYCLKWTTPWTLCDSFTSGGSAAQWTSSSGGDYEAEVGLTWGYGLICYTNSGVGIFGHPGVDVVDQTPFGCAPPFYGWRAFSHVFSNGLKVTLAFEYGGAHTLAFFDCCFVGA